MKNRLINNRSLRFALLLLLLSMGISNAIAFNFSAVCPTEQTLYYTITDATNHYVNVVRPANSWSGYTKPTGNLIIPSEVTYNDTRYSVTAIYDDAFSNCSDLISVTIPNSVTRLHKEAFSYCSSLIAVIIPNSVTSIDHRAFRGCSSLTSVTIPNSLTSIDFDTFYGCSSLTSITIPNLVTSILYNAFRGCTNLAEIVSLNFTPPTAGSNVFYGVNRNIPVYVPIGSASAYQSASYWSSFTNYIEVVANFSAICSSGQTVYYAVTDMNNHYVEVIYPGSSSSAPWEGYEQPTGNLVLPETVEYQGITYTVKGIHNNTFYGCSGLTQVTISENIEYVEAKAFWNCPNLETVNFNAVNCDMMYTYYNNAYNSVFSSDASGSAPALTRVTIGSGVQRIPDYAFKNAENIYQRLVVPASVTEIGNYAFYNCNSMVQMVIQGNGLQTIGDYAFYGCTALQTPLDLPNSVVSTGRYSFYGCNHIPSLTIGEGMSSIGEYAFWNCPAMVTVNFNSVNCENMKTRTGAGTNANPYIDYSVFNNGTEAGGATPITTLNIGANVTNIPNYAFYNSPNATHNLVLPEGLAHIGNSAFYNGGFSGDLTIHDQTQTVGSEAFYGCVNFTSLSLGAQTTGDKAFYGCSNLALLTIGEGATSIGGYAFWNCPSLATVHFNAVNCTTMNTASAYSVFNVGTTNGDETPITSLIIGANVTNIPDFAFYNSPNAANELPLPNSLTNIGQYAFYNCSSLTGSLLIPNAVTSIGQYAFYDCSGFNGTLTLSNSLSQINQYTFHGCSGFNGTLVIPNSVLTIANNAFEDCSGFTGHLSLHDALTTIGKSAFYGCSSLAELTIGQGVVTIDGSAFWNCPQLQTVHFNAVNCTAMNTNSQYSVFNSGANNGGATAIVTLSIGENVKRIPDYAFRNSVNATSDIIIPDATTYIGTYAFFGFRSPLLTIGEGVQSIGEYAFWYCPLLQTVNYNAVNCTQMYTRTGQGTNASPYVYYAVFSSNINASGDAPILTLNIGKHVQTIPDYAFKGCSSINNKLLFPNVLTSIGVQSFYDCNSIIGDLVLPNSVTSLGEYAFYNCHDFDGSLIIGSGIQTINQYTFADCSGFTGALIIGRSVSSIGAYSFRNCSAFSTVISEHPTPPTALNTSFNNMNYSIPVHVPYAMIPAYQAATGWSSFTNYREQFVFDQLGNDSWSDTQNWYSFELPTANDVVCVNSDCHMDMEAEVLHLYVLNLNDALTINDGQTLTTTYGIGTLQPSQLVIADGGQLVNPISNAFGTVQRNISGYDTGSDGWFTLGTPIYEGTATSTLATGTYDLFYYNEPIHYWMNEKIEENSFTLLEPAQGCLYANQAQQTIAFAGQINASNAEFSLPVTCEGSPLAGYTLVGNPYTNNLNIGDVKLNGTPLMNYYKINGNGGLVAYTANDPILPGEGFLVVATAGGTLTFSPSQGRSANLPEMQGNDGPTRGFCLPTHGDLTNINAYSSEVTCTIVATANPTVGGTVQGMGTFDEGVACTLIATANEGYDFVNWTENGNQVSTEASYTFIVSGNRTLVANFVSNQPNNYFITANANPTEGGTVTGGGNYNHGQTCTLTATANEGYSFVNWTENDEVVSTDATYTFEVTGSRTLVANFESIASQWQPVSQGTSGSMVLIGKIQINGIDQTSDQLELGVFCGNECRGSSLAHLFEYVQPSYYMVDPMVYGDAGDTYTFKLYDHSIGQELVLTSPASITFNENGYGTVFEPYVLNFLSAVTVTATVNPEDAGTVSGAGEYSIGASCTLTATANTGYQFKHWTLNGEVVSDEPAYTFTVTESAAYVANFDIVHSQALSSGWNWWSTYIEMDDTDGLGMLKNNLGNSCIRIQSRNQYLDNYTNFWYGTLAEITNEQSYRIRTNTDCEAALHGAMATPESHPITVNNGWNWVGYPCSMNMGLGAALGGITPEVNDQMKGRHYYAIYLGNNFWYGTLNTLEPGQGYMYLSNSNETKTLTYQTGRNENLVANITTERNHFTPSCENYADNLTLTAVVELDGLELRSDEYELAAFAGDECRGSVKLLYVAPIDRYVAFLLVYGDAEEDMRFVLTNGMEVVLSDDVFRFVADATIGTITRPAVIRFRTLGVDDNPQEFVHVFPNPSKGIFNVEGSGIRKVEVVNVLGQTVFSEEVGGNHVQVDLKDKASGMYMLQVITDKGIKTTQIIKE